MKSLTLEAWCAKVVFQIQLPICAGNVSTNISIHNVRVNMRKSEHDTIFEISLTINLKDKSFQYPDYWKIHVKLLLPLDII